MTAAQLLTSVFEKYADNIPKPQLTTSNVGGGISAFTPQTQSLGSPTGGLNSAPIKPMTTGLNPPAGLTPPTPAPAPAGPSSLVTSFQQRKELGRAGMDKLMTPSTPAAAPAPPPATPALASPTTPMVHPNSAPLSIAPQTQPAATTPAAPANPQMPGNTQPQPIVSNTQGTMTDVNGQPVATEPPQPKGPEAFVDAMKERSGGKEPTGGVIDMTKPLDVKAVEAHLGDVNVPPEQKQKFLGDLTEKLKHENPQYYEGFQDMQAGRTDTEAAKAYQGRLTQAKDEMVQQAAAADPQKASTPQGFGEIVSGVMNTFQNMPPAMQAMVGIGLPVGLIGIMSSLFGGGGMGMGIMGALGLGAGVLGGAAGGMFGQGAQNMTADAAYNMGSFLGMIPEGKQDLSMLTADDPIAAIKAKGSGGFSPAAIKEQLAKAEQQKQQLATLMRLPEGMRPRMLQNLSDTNMTDEQAVRAAQNAAMLHGHLNDPKSELSQMQQQGQRYVDDPVSTFATEILPQKAYNAAQSAAQGAYDYTIGNSRMPWNWGNNQQQQTAQASPGTVKGAHVNINKFIEKWAFNDMDAKELSDLKAEKAKGAPYRVEDAKREHALNLRSQAMATPTQDEPPVRVKKIVVMCVKKASRCWAGYEPVPGKKPYSNDSCRPVGSGKKKKTDKKKSAK